MGKKLYTVEPSPRGGWKVVRAGGHVALDRIKSRERADECAVALNKRAQAQN